MADLYRQTTDDITIEFEEKYEDQFEAFAKYHVSTCDLLTADPRLVAAWGEQKVLKCHKLASDLETRISEEIRVERVDFDVDEEEVDNQEQQPQNTISTGVSAIDTCMNGGFPTGTLCEVAGESAAGKSHFLLQLCVNVQLARGNGGLGKRAVFISTESGLETRRLVQMIKRGNEVNGGISPGHVTEKDSSNGISLDHVAFIACRDLEQQERVFQYNLPNLLENDGGGSYGLVVIDSLAAHYRAEELTSKGDFTSRDKRLLRTLHHLKGLARKHNVAVVFANQISALPGKELTIAAEFLPTLLEKQLPYFSGWKESIVRHTQQRDTGPDSTPQDGTSEDFLLSSSEPDTHHTNGSPPPSQFQPSPSQLFQPSQPYSQLPSQLASQYQLTPTRSSFLAGSKVPTLGQVLANSVDIRTVLKHNSRDSTRTFEVVFSNPYKFDASVVPYEITTGGLVDVE